MKLRKYPWSMFIVFNVTSSGMIDGSKADFAVVVVDIFFDFADFA